MKKKTVLWSLVLLLSYVAAFIVGSATGRQTTLKYYSEEFETANAHVLIGHYSAYKNIASNIRESRYGNAKCEAEMMATAMLESMKSCMADANCKQAVSKKAREFAPESLGEAPIPFETRTSCP